MFVCHCQETHASDTDTPPPFYSEAGLSCFSYGAGLLGSPSGLCRNTEGKKNVNLSECLGTAICF